MHVLARHPSPHHPFKLDLRDTGNRKPKIAGDGLLGAMDDVLSQIHEAYRLAGELMKELPASQNDPAYLAEHCRGIVRAYVAAIHMLQPQGEDAVATRPSPPFASDRLRQWRPDQQEAGGTGNPFLSSPSSAQLAGRLPEPSSFLTLAEAFGSRATTEMVCTTGADVAGTSGGPARRLQPRQGRRRCVPSLGVR
jgi:hypothetical protein